MSRLNFSKRSENASFSDKDFNDKRSEEQMNGFMRVQTGQSNASALQCREVKAQGKNKTQAQE